MTNWNTCRTFTAIIFALLTASCIDSNKTTGSGLLPEDHVLRVRSASFDLPVQLKISDSIQTIFPESLVVGSYRDSDFGFVEASAAFQFQLSRDSLSFGANPIPKSFKMYISVADRSYLYEKDSYIPQNFKVYILNKVIDSTIAYNNSIKTEDYNPAHINLGGSTYFGGDTLTLELSLEYARQILSATKEELEDSKLFTERFKGLYLAVDPQPDALTGGRFNIIDPNDIFFTIEYTHTDVSKSIDKDSTIYLYVPSSKPYTNSFKHSSQDLASTDPQDKLFIEGLAGLKPYIDFTDVKREIIEWSNTNKIDISRLIIAKAELRFPYEQPEDYTRMLYFPSQIFLSTRNQGGSSYKTVKTYDPVADISYSESNGSINRSQLYYTLDISSYLQKVLTDKVSGDALQTFLMPILQKTDYYSGATYYFIQNLLYTKAILNGTGMPRRPQLILTYTLI